MSKDTITRGTLNVFADLGLPGDSNRQTKTRLAMAVNQLIEERKLKQTDAASLLGIPQPRVSALVRYKLTDFSIEKLMSFLTLLDRDVDIFIRPRARDRTGTISVLSVTNPHNKWPI